MTNDQKYDILVEAKMYLSDYAEVNWFKMEFAERENKGQGQKYLDLYHKLHEVIDSIQEFQNEFKK